MGSIDRELKKLNFEFGRTSRLIVGHRRSNYPRNGLNSAEVEVTRHWIATRIDRSELLSGGVESCVIEFWRWGDRKGLGIRMVEGMVKSWERGRIESCGRVPGSSGAGVGDQIERISRTWAG